MKRPTQESNYKKQLTGVGALVALIVFILGAFAVIRIVAAQSNRPSAPSGSDATSQLARNMERVFPIISILGVNENRDTNDLEVLFYDPEPLAEWGAKEGGQMDEVMFLAMKFSADQDKSLALYILHPTPAVGLDGENVSVLFVNSVFYCFLESIQEINWNTANHDTIEESCVLLSAGYNLGKAEKILWPLEQSP